VRGVAKRKRMTRRERREEKRRPDVAVGYQRGYDTPEEAARGDIPERYAPALSVEISEDGTYARVLLATNESPAIEYYEVHCELVDGQWRGGVGGNASGPEGERPWSA
jgi:hypothetical protein